MYLIYNISDDDLSLIVSKLRGHKKNEITGVMQKVLPGPMAVMSWIESEVARQIRNGKTEVTDFSFWV